VVNLDVAITKMSSKGQVVIPVEMRNDILEGEKLLIIKNDKQIIIKKASELDKNMTNDLEFAKKTESAWKRIKAKKETKMGFDDFISEMKKW
jgi:AbrB family looped-hinge helix DNA binding protein